MSTALFALWLVLCFLAFALWTVFAITAGMVAGFKSLEKTKFSRMDDGDDGTYITLALGPFRYRIRVPEREE